MKPIGSEAYFRFIAQRYRDVDLGAIGTFLEVIGVLKSLNCGMDSYFQKLGISQARFKMMLSLLYNEGEGGISPASLADNLGVKRATITGLLDTLENDSWIERHPDPNDRRGLLIKITEAGKQKLDSVLPAHYLRISKAMSQLTGSEQDDLRRLIRKFGKAVEEMDGEVETGSRPSETDQEEKVKI